MSKGRDKPKLGEIIISDYFRFRKKADLLEEDFHKLHKYYINTWNYRDTEMIFLTSKDMFVKSFVMLQL